MINIAWAHFVRLAGRCMDVRFAYLGMARPADGSCIQRTFKGDHLYIVRGALVDSEVASYTLCR
ncbi:MAG: hypothetical protein CFE21_14770 [Bacteroidetes bacterium B1(2017)]|nr:MAG: hypothetical protein CFE21_14770 [Bacteroidetes bacterium B1(2017)]